jgi:hypothetical protein
MRKLILLTVSLIFFQNSLQALETDTHRALNSVISNVTTPDDFNLDSGKMEKVDTKVG